MARTRSEPSTLTTKNGYTDTENVQTCFFRQKICKIKEYFPNIVKEFIGYDIENFSSINNFITWMHHPTDAASLGIARMLFGIVMLIDIPDERGGGNLDLRYGDPKDCHFPLFDFLQPLSLPKMGIVYFVMWMGALGIAFGNKYKLSCLMFVVPYWYIFLLNKAAWNNHSYLYGLCGTLFLFTSANRFCSLDHRKLKREEQVVPYWNYFIIKFQFFILYFLAGVKKMSAEWLSGYAMTNLGYHWVFTPFRFVLGVQMTELLIIHWFGAIFDLTIAFFLIWEKTRIPATPFAIMFHLMNSRLFSIGMFPWLCLAELPLFYKANWPRTLWAKIYTQETPKEKIEENEKLSKEIQTIFATKQNEEKQMDQGVRCRKSRITKQQGHSAILERKSSKTMKYTFRDKLRIFFVLLYCLLQFFLPFSHFITKGYNNWTNGLYGYSWDMMVHSYDTVLTSIKIVDNNNGQEHYLEPYAFSDFDRWTKHADMAIQYSKCIERNLLDDFRNNPKTILTSTNFSIYFDIWCSMNGRFQQRVFDPRVNILNAQWSPFEDTKWVLPLLNELTHLRPKLNKITNNVLSWGNYTDVMFIADFPGLVMENFISPDLGNVTLSVLEGAVRLKANQEDSTVQSIGAGQSISVTPGFMHQVTTTSSTPSCYMYTYVNNTMIDLKIQIGQLDFDQPILPLWDEFIERASNYMYFIVHIANSILFLLFGEPMPRRLRERS